MVGQVEETYRRFAVEEAHDSSPTYERLALALAPHGVTARQPGRSR